jgi:hypothetical protein
MYHGFPRRPWEPGRNRSRSHALRGNAVTDAPRRVRASYARVLYMQRDAERPRKGSHGDRGNQDINLE